MKILIENYSNSMSTEHMYLDACLKHAEGVESVIWNPKVMSFYDAMDIAKPDVALTQVSPEKHFLDVMRYSKSSNGTDFIFKIRADKNELNLITNYVDLHSIACPFVISDSFMVDDGLKVLSLLPAADIFLNSNNNPVNKIQVGVVTTGSNKEVVEKVKNNLKGYSYHIIRVGNTSDGLNWDIKCNIVGLSNLVNRYGQILIADDMSEARTQATLDCILKSPTTYLTPYARPASSSGYETLFIQSLFGMQNRERKEFVIKNHTCFNRAESLVTALNLPKAQASLQSKIELLVKNYSLSLQEV